MAPPVAERDAPKGNSEIRAEVSKDLIDFHHPYTPYDIQETFMGTVYEVLSESKIGILESPTGTVSRVSLVPIGMKHSQRQDVCQAAIVIDRSISHVAH